MARAEIWMWGRVYFILFTSEQRQMGYIDSFDGIQGCQSLVTLELNSNIVLSFEW